MGQPPLGISDYIGLVVFLGICGGLVYLFITIPPALDASVAKQKAGFTAKGIEMESNTLRIKTNKTYTAEDAAYAMIKGGKDTAKRIQATGAATFTKAGSAGVSGVKAVGNVGAAGLGKVGDRIPGRKHSTTR